MSRSCFLRLVENTLILHFQWKKLVLKFFIIFKNSNVLKNIENSF